MTYTFTEAQLRKIDAIQTTLLKEIGFVPDMTQMVDYLLRSYPSYQESQKQANKLDEEIKQIHRVTPANRWKIEAIKHVRTVTSMNLKEANDYVEALIRT